MLGAKHWARRLVYAAASRQFRIGKLQAPDALKSSGDRTSGWFTVSRPLLRPAADCCNQAIWLLRGNTLPKWQNKQAGRAKMAPVQGSRFDLCCVFLRSYYSPMSAKIGTAYFFCGEAKRANLSSESRCEEGGIEVCAEAASLDPQL